MPSSTPPWEGQQPPDGEHFVRPYVLTSGRTRPAHGRFDLISQVVTVGPPPEADAGLGPEHLSILRLCRIAMSVAELAGRLNLPGAAVRVLLGDLLERGHVLIQEPAPETAITDADIYEAVIDGLRAI
ncbi:MULTISPECIES: DUF742 domain-containing protein [Thermomonospora]|uniref:DUF742 domain-containing protein n=1 Tax=Thermomonospora curvata (strain ATCC 19995 / DSM 43183 / JCM 3096 / KCTC 9072 / NBRC 15933 / NCIMB 10081 / Henssen B9) TaxID=471852 RepID=D1AD32_THECD|nr:MULTISPECIES: DUF742 domain-containing protein [Thermomonospora]ACY99341.1 protein of unknown function DUF742 [Thermomonospora curvata DSM 43183]PKK12392.1 MAG: DUF742 domain-containing protein [Thermomonospora sp. CIF 1]